MKVDRYNYAEQFGDLQPLLEKIQDVLLDGRYVLTEEVVEFEQMFANFTGVRHARGVNTGTDALIIALMALNVKTGDEVITHANTFYATVAAIRLIGATPVLVDADEETFLINQAQVPAAINSKTRIILPVHLFGKPTPLKELLKLAEAHGIYLLEDAAQAHGARIDGQCVGSMGAVGCFSFHPSKNLAAAGDGGAITTNSEAIDERIQLYRALGQLSQNNHVVIGLNSKLDTLQALVLSWKLPMLEEWNQRRRTVARLYIERLHDLPLRFQATSPDEEHVYHLFQIRTEHRDQLLEFLRSKAIDAVVRYPTPIHMQKAFSDCGWVKGQYPIAEQLANELLCLPVRPDLSLAEMDFIADTVRAYFRG